MYVRVCVCGAGRTCERVKAINNRMGHKGRVKTTGRDKERGRKGQRGERGRIDAGRARKRSEKRVLEKSKAEGGNLTSLSEILPQSE